MIITLDDPLEYHIIPKEFKEVKKKELLELLSTYEKDPISYINNYVGAGGTTVRVEIVGDDKKDYLKKQQQKLAKKNNPIELD